MASRCSSCVAWLLLTSYAVLLGAAGLGIYISINNFWQEEPSPPTPPPEHSVTTTTPNPNRYRNYDRYEDHVPEDYKEYYYSTEFFAKAFSDTRVFVMIPCALCLVVGALVLVCGLYSRKFFMYTFSLYSSLALWVHTFVWCIVYQHLVAVSSRMEVDSACWVVGAHVVLLLILSVQIALCIVELRKQNADWPTLNWLSLFSVESVLVTARLTLTVYTCISLINSEILRGFRQSSKSLYSGYELSMRFPLVLSITCLGAVCYNVVAVIETVLSMLLGKLHNCMTTVTVLLSALSSTVVAVIASPVIIRTFMSNSYVNDTTMYFAVALSIVTYIHLVTCLAFPSASRTSPVFISKVKELLYKAIVHSTDIINRISNTEMTSQPWYSTLKHKKDMSFIINIVSSVSSLILIIIIVAVWNSPLYRAWGSVLALCATSSTLVRTLPAVVMQLKFKQRETISEIQKLMSIGLEALSLTVAGIVMYARSYYGGEIFAGVASHAFVAFHIAVMVNLVKGIRGAATSEEVQCLPNDEEVSSQDEQKEKDDELLA